MCEHRFNFPLSSCTVNYAPLCGAQSIAIFAWLLCVRRMAILPASMLDLSSLQELVFPLVLSALYASRR
jgi:hypothetical protein